MKLFGFEITRSRQGAKQETRSPWQLRPNDGQGPFTRYFQNFIPRKIESTFYEFLREAIPIIDAAINRLASLDGHIIVKGENEALVDEIREWMDNVSVNDIQRGMQSFHQNVSSEAFEQGFGLGEFVVDKKRTDIVGLRVADSKYIKFKRTDTGINIYQKADTDIQERLLNPNNLLYFSINNENQNPYGTPLLRSCEFVSKILATLQNSLANVWERFGDPSYSIIYKTSKRDGADLAARRKTIEDEFNAAIRAKREGKSADFIRAIDQSSEIKIDVIGAAAQLLEFEIPSRHILEQIIAKTGLPPWMLGMHWSTTERISDSEAEMLLADVATRQAAKMPRFSFLVKTLLLLRGRTWKKGDWWLEWAQVNLKDIVKQAQARFLNAQADMMAVTSSSSAASSAGQRSMSSIQHEKPYLNEHACRLHDPKKYDRIRRENNKFGEGIHAIWGIKEGEPVELQAIRFDKDKFTVEEAKKWCSDHKYKCILFEPATNEKNPPISPLAKGGIKGDGCSCGQKELNRPTPWPELDQVETDYEKELKFEWNELKSKIFLILKLNETKTSLKSPLAKGGERGSLPSPLAGEVYPPLAAPKATRGKGEGVKQDLPSLESFTFTEEQRAMIMQSFRDWIGTFDIKDDNSAVRWYYGQAYSLGLIQAAKLIGKDRPILDIIKNSEIFNDLCKNGFQLVKDNATKAILQQIIPTMEAHMIAGSNPLSVASVLERTFGDQNSDWERLARTEMSSAAERAKLDEWNEWGVNRVEFTPAPDACPICLALAGDYNIGDCPIPGTGTHPRCRCSIRPAESEV